MLKKSRKAPIMRKLVPTLILLLSIFSAQSTPAWNSTGHQLVASIAWDNMTPQARQRVIALLLEAPNDACLKQLFSNDSRPLDVRQREFFIKAATWPDIVRPRKKRNGKPDMRPCIKYHEREWHFVDHFWKGISGSSTNRPTDLSTPPIAEINAVERLEKFQDTVVGNGPASKRAMELAWILHLVGDIHQPLHASGRVTSAPGESKGDQGGNLFKLDNGSPLHSFWDGIVDETIVKKSESMGGYINRLTTRFETDFPRSKFTNLESAQFNVWTLESLQKAKDTAYPISLKRNQNPGGAYQSAVFRVSEESIAKAGYRLADLLNKLFG
jgi:hypothetical protein